MSVRLFIFCIVCLSLWPPTSLQAQKKVIRFHPENPFEIKKDTSIEGHDLSWVYQSKPNSFITQTYTSGKRTFIDQYRDAELVVTLKSHRFTFDKSHFQPEIGFESDGFIIILFDFEGFIPKSQEFQFFLIINKPETDWSYPINLYIKSDGSLRFEQVIYEDDY